MEDSLSIKPVALIPTQEGAIGRFELSVPRSLVEGAENVLSLCRFEARPVGGVAWEPVLDVRTLRSASTGQENKDEKTVQALGALMLPFKNCSVEVRVCVPSPSFASGAAAAPTQASDAGSTAASTSDANLASASVQAAAQCTFSYVLSYDFNAATEHPINNKYGAWFKQHRASKHELSRQRKRAKEIVGPTFSIVVPLYETPLPFLHDAVQSVLQQTYPAWQLVLVNASPNKSELTAALKRYAAQDRRVTVVGMASNEGIVSNTNRGIQEATGDFIAFMDHDDMLEPNILYEYARAIQAEPTCDFLYCDEDLFDKRGHYFDPLFKPDFNVDLLRTHNYITHMYAIRTSLLKTLELPGKEMEGAQDYDLTFKATEKARHIAHIPKVLYHWRAHEKSTNIEPGSKPYAEEAGRKAVQAHLDRVYQGCTVHTGELTNTYTVDYPVTGNHLVSIIIPTREQAPALKRCVTSILQNAGYEQFEIVIVENGSTQKETFALYEELKKQDKRIKVVEFQQEDPQHFNYSALINFGAREAKGDYFLFLNNDVQAITKGFLKTLLGFALRPDVGVVGAKLLYPDETIQHAGVGIQFGNKDAEPAFHLFAHLPRGTYGYHDRATKTQDYSAVTGACQMTPRSVFESVDGYDEAYAVAFNDVDYCLKVIEHEKLVVWCAQVEFFHDESLSRGFDSQDDEKATRASQERALLQERWGTTYRKGDPYLNPNYAPISPYLKPVYGYTPAVLWTYAKRILHRSLIRIQGVLKKR